MNKTKKIVFISTIATTCITSLILIMLLFDISLFGELNLKFLAMFATLAIGGFFAINSMNMISKNRIIGTISLSLICASIFLIILFTWISLENEVLLDITITLGLLSVLFNIIVSTGLDLGKKYLVVQIVVYIISAIIVVLSTLAIFNVISLLSILTFFLLFVILGVVGLIILKVLAKKQLSDRLDESKNIVKISKDEYAILLDKAKKYDEIMKNKNEE